METLALNVEGMTCNHCKQSVEKAVGAITGVEAVEVVLADKKVNVTLDTSVTTVDSVKDAIEDIGFDVVE